MYVGLWEEDGPCLGDHLLRVLPDIVPLLAGDLTAIVQLITRETEEAEASGCTLDDLLGVYEEVWFASERWGVGEHEEASTNGNVTLNFTIQLHSDSPTSTWNIALEYPLDQLRNREELREIIDKAGGVIISQPENLPVMTIELPSGIDPSFLLAVSGVLSVDPDSAIQLSDNLPRGSSPFPFDPRGI